jgi:hypothetical protein
MDGAFNPLIKGMVLTRFVGIAVGLLVSATAAACSECRRAAINVIQPLV